jgi:hypothetical protein
MYLKGKKNLLSNEQNTGEQNPLYEVIGETNVTVHVRSSAFSNSLSTTINKCSQTVQTHLSQNEKDRTLSSYRQTGMV